MLARLLTVEDQQRVNQTLQKFARHNTSRWALTGSFATEHYTHSHGGSSSTRPLHDIDFMVGSFADIPSSLGIDFLVNHVHPDDPLGKNPLQCVDPDTRIQFDIFHAYGTVMDRIQPTVSTPEFLGVIALQDLTARAARLSWDLVTGAAVAPKYIQDFIRLLEIADLDEVSAVWPEHRKPPSPEIFSKAASQVPALVQEHAKNLVALPYSTDVNTICVRCRETPTLHLADKRRILALLGYC